MEQRHAAQGSSFGCAAVGASVHVPGHPPSTVILLMATVSQLLSVKRQLPSAEHHVPHAKSAVCYRRCAFLSSWRTPGAPGAPGIQINVPAIHPNALPPNITPSSSPGYLTPAVSGAHVWAEWLHHPCLPGGPQHGDKKWGKRGTIGKIGGNFAQRTNILFIQWWHQAALPSYKQSDQPPTGWWLMPYGDSVVLKGCYCKMLPSHSPTDQSRILECRKMGKMGTVRGNGGKWGGNA